jgi:hypothetical protein
MKKKDFIRIINEEIGEFDFLNNEKYLKEQETIKILENPEFQKQFIIDSITKMRDKIKFNNFTTQIFNDPEIQDQQHNDLNIEVNAEITYSYNENNDPINFSLNFIGENVRYQTGYDYSHGDRDTPSATDVWYKNINWYEIEPTIYTLEGDDVEFTAFNKAPDNIKELFIRSYIQDTIETESDINDIREKMPKYGSF